MKNGSAVPIWMSLAIAVSLAACLSGCSIPLIDRDIRAVHPGVASFDESIEGVWIETSGDAGDGSSRAEEPRATRILSLEWADGETEELEVGWLVRSPAVLGAEMPNVVMPVRLWGPDGGMTIAEIVAAGAGKETQRLVRSGDPSDRSSSSRERLVIEVSDRSASAYRAGPWLIVEARGPVVFLGHLHEQNRNAYMALRVRGETLSLIELDHPRDTMSTVSRARLREKETAEHVYREELLRSLVEAIESGERIVVFRRSAYVLED